MKQNTENVLRTYSLGAKVPEGAFVTFAVKTRNIFA